MKKILLFIALLASGFAASAQILPYLNQDWLIRPGENSAVTVTNTTLVYNNASGHLLLSNRNSGISILNPANGAVLGTLVTDAGWAANGYKYTKIRVASDGAIYATNMTTASGTLYVYKWTSETDNAPKRSSITVPTRAGESLAVVGTGTNAVLYVGGAGGHKNIYRFTTNDGDYFTLDKTFEMDANDRSKNSISPISSTQFITNGSGIRKITLDIDNSAIPTNTGLFGTLDATLFNAEYFEYGGRQYIAMSGGVLGGALPSPLTANNAVKIKIFDITGTPTTGPENALFSTYPSNLAANTNPNAYADVAVKNNGNGSHTFFHVVHGHGLASYTTSSTLPVSLTSFNASLTKGQSTLTWETSSESNNKGFEVLRSTDGKDFTKVDFVASKAQNGNSSTSLSYSYVDATAKAGLNYYQLNQVDLDGKSELFKEVKTVNVSLKTEGVTVFPNPATTHITVNTAGEDYKGFKYELFDANGKKVLSEKAKAAQQDISLGKLPSSIYYLKVSKNGTEQKTVKVIKQ